MTWAFDPLTPLAYGAILVDPPWRFTNWSAAGERKNPSAHYGCMDLDALRDLPVGHLAAPNCMMWMWATAPVMPDAIDLMRAWGFRYVTMGSWAKRSRADNTWAFGTGYALRSACEPYLIGAIGRPRFVSRSIRNIIVAPVREHSRKPDAQYDHIEALSGDVRRCELFARSRRPGWESWGNEVDRFPTQEGAAS